MASQHKLQTNREKSRTGRKDRRPPGRESTARPETAGLLLLRRAVADPAGASPADMLALQRSYGNWAVSSLIQAKLTVGPPGDRYEQEADRVAEQVVSRGAEARDQGKRVQRQEWEEDELQAKPLAATITPLVQRQAIDEDPLASFMATRAQKREAQQRDRQKDIEEYLQPKSFIQRQEEEEEEVQAKRQSPMSNPQFPNLQTSSELEGRLASQRGRGQPLPDKTRAEMEAGFGADFSGVRIHTGGEAGSLNRDLRAQAFTHGRDIYFSPGKFDPDSGSGKRLLAHELTHVIQQSGANSRIQRWGDPPKMFAKKGPGTTHDEVTKDAFASLEPSYKMWYSDQAQEYLASRSEDIDHRAGFLVGSLAPGKIYGGVWAAWGKTKRGVKRAGRAIASFGRKTWRGLRRGLGWLGEKASNVEGSGLEQAVTGQPRERQEQPTGFWKKLWGGIKEVGSAIKEGAVTSLALPFYTLTKGVQALGSTAGITEEEREEKKQEAEAKYQRSGRNIEQMKANQYDNLNTYWRSSSEAPNHGEAGRYKGDGAAADQARVDAYLDKASGAWAKGDRRQALSILAYALHSAEDRGAHGDGRPGTGHDPRKATPPPPGATVTGYYNASDPDDGFDCDRKSANPGGYAFALQQAHYVLKQFVNKIGIMTEEGEQKSMPEALRAGGGLAGFQKPGKFKRFMRGTGRVFGKDVIRW